MTRSILLIAAALLCFVATMTFESSDANAVVCARGVYRAGCAGYRGAVVVRSEGPPLLLSASPPRSGVGARIFPLAFPPEGD